MPEPISGFQHLPVLCKRWHPQGCAALVYVRFVLNGIEDNPPGLDACLASVDLGFAFGESRAIRQERHCLSRGSPGLVLRLDEGEVLLLEG